MEPHLPGTAKVAAQGHDAYRISMKISMGFLRPTVNADVQLSDVVKPESFTIALSGKSMGAGVTGTAEVEVSSASDATSTTLLKISGAIQTSGLLNKIADSKIENAATGFLESYLASVEQTARG